MIQPSKEAVKYTIWVDPQCPPGILYFSGTEYFCDPGLFQGILSMLDSMGKTRQNMPSLGKKR